VEKKQAGQQEALDGEISPVEEPQAGTPTKTLFEVENE